MKKPIVHLIIDTVTNNGTCASMTKCGGRNFGRYDDATLDMERVTCTACKARPLSAIALDIRKHWTKPYFGVVPYIQAMLQLDTIHQAYGYDDSRSIVNYFLSNAASWRGPIAKAVKAELKALLK